MDKLNLSIKNDILPSLTSSFGKGRPEMNEDHDRADQFEQKSEESESSVPDPQLETMLLETEMQMSLDKVKNQLSHNIPQQQKEMPRWQQRLQESLQRTFLGLKRKRKSGGRASS